MRASDAVGRHGEDIAAAHLARLGYVVLARNWRCSAGEIDIVARDGDTLVICEVKTRRGVRFGSPLEAVTAEKAARLARLAVAYRRRTGSSATGLRIDLVGVLLAGPAGPVVQHLRGVA